MKKKLHQLNSTGKGEYYLAQMPQKKFKRMLAQKKVKLPRPCNCLGTIHFAPGEVPGRFTKKMVDRFPKYLRRGGEYGHDKYGPPKISRRT